MDNLEEDREQLLRRYIELKEKAKEIETEIESLKGKVFFTISEIQDEIGKKQVAFEDYIFTINYCRTYKYPDYIKKIEEDLKAAKKQAEASGEASVVRETGYVVLKKKNAM